MLEVPAKKKKKKRYAKVSAKKNPADLVKARRKSIKEILLAHRNFGTAKSLKVPEPKDEPKSPAILVRANKKVLLKAATMSSGETESDEVDKESNKVVVTLKAPTYDHLSEDSSEEESKQDNSCGVPTIQIEPCTEL